MKLSGNQVLKKVMMAAIRTIGIFVVFAYAFMHTRGDDQLFRDTPSLGTAHADAPTAATAGTAASAAASSGGNSGAGSGCSSGGGTGCGCDSGK